MREAQALSVRAMRGASKRAGACGKPARSARANWKQSIPAGSTTPVCAELVQMCELIDTEFGSSNAPREIPRYSGQRSIVSVSVVPHRGQKWTCTCLELLSDLC